MCASIQPCVHKRAQRERERERQVLLTIKRVREREGGREREGERREKREEREEREKRRAREKRKRDRVLTLVLPTRVDRT